MVFFCNYGKSNLTMITQLVSVITSLYKVDVLNYGDTMSFCYYFVTVMGQSGQLFLKEFMKVTE